MDDICKGIKNISFETKVRKSNKSNELSKLNKSIKKITISPSNIVKNETYSKKIVKQLLMYMNDEIDGCICDGNISMQGDIRKVLDIQCIDSDEDGEIIDYCRNIMCISCLTDKHSNYLKSKYNVN